MISFAFFGDKSHAVPTKQYWPLLIRERVCKSCIVFLLQVKYITYLNPPMVNPFRPTDLVKLAGEGLYLNLSFILNYCLSHLLLEGGGGGGGNRYP